MKFKLTNEKHSIKFWIACLLLGIILVMGYTELVSAESNLGTFKQNTCFDLYQTCDDCTYVNLTAIKYPNGTIETMNLDMVKINQDFTYNFCNSTNLGDYTYTVAGDKRGVYSIETMSFEVTPSGEDLSLQNTVIQLVMILFLILLIFSFYYLSHNINFEKWNDSIFKKYQNRNYVKLVLSSIGYHILKNSFIIYYLIGLPIILTFSNLAHAYGIENLVSLLSAVLVIYFVGILLVGLIFLGYVQEWFMDLLEKVRNMKWGIE